MVRETTRQDSDAVISLAEASGQFDADGIEHIRQTLTDHLNGKGEGVWFTADDGEPVGVVYCEPEVMTNGTWNALMLLIRADRHGKGYGSGLMRQAEQALAERGARLMIVETSSLDDFERARGFYPRCGYTEEARIANFFDAGDDKITFTKPLVAGGS